MVISIILGNFMVNSVLTVVLVLVGVAFFTLFERNLIGLIQNRTGPMKVGPMGCMQPMVDALNLVTKYAPNNIIGTNRGILSSLSPLLVLVIASASWLAYPCVYAIWDCQTFILFSIVIISLMVYGIISIGWVSNSNYASLGALRAIAQSVSYEMVLVLGVLGLVWTNGSFAFSDCWQLIQMGPLLLVPFLVSFLGCLVSLLAESGRVPFDLTEGEAEIVAGWNVELSGQSFTLTFLGEQLSIIWITILLVSLFIGLEFLLWKAASMVVLVVVIRVAYPRIRFDNVIHVCWLVLLPLMASSCCMYVLCV